MKTIRRQYRMVMDFLLRELSMYFFLTICTFVLLTIFCTYLFKENPEWTWKLLSAIADKFQGLMENGEISLLNLFLNNLQAAVLGVLVGLIPFLFLPVLGIFSNAAVMGLVFAQFASNAPLWKIIVLGILPHGIFELTAIFLCYAMGICLCWNLTKKIVGHKDRTNMKDLLQNCLRTTVLIVLPLLFVAALIETYVTVQLIETFM